MVSGATIEHTQLTQLRIVLTGACGICARLSEGVCCYTVATFLLHEGMPYGTDLLHHAQLSPWSLYTPLRR